jgi:HPt (histidine-containing phosphotransfer) domain-containing protein
MAARWRQSQPGVVHQVGVIEEASAAAAAAGLDDALRGRALRAAHNLVGLLGTFGLSLGAGGFAEASDLAQQVEYLLEAEPPLPTSAAAQLATLVAGLRQAVDEAGRSDGAPGRPADPG